MRIQPVEQLGRELQINFLDISLFKAAFTHSSYKNEHRHENVPDNERLEFLGDAVLELCVSRYLYLRYPTAPEGDMTRMRAAIVCEPSLVGFARTLGFSRYLRLGKGEEQTGGRDRASLLADVFEAFIGALYLDQGLQGVEAFLTQHFFRDLADLDESSRKDYKTALQEHVQRNNLGDLSYETVDERGPAHDRQFVIRVHIGGKVFGEGVGRSKKEAEQQAAQTALQIALHVNL